MFVIKTRLISSLLLIFICLSLCTPVIAAKVPPPAQESPAAVSDVDVSENKSLNAANKTITVNVKIFQDRSYQMMYADTNNMYDTWQNVIPPFVAQWNLNLNPQIMNMGNNVSVTDTCTLGTLYPCTTNDCGVYCINEYIQTSNHHKNLYAMYYQFANPSWRGNSDILLGVTAVYACANVDGVHKANYVYGLTGVSAGYTVIVNNSLKGMKSNVRLLQHELSHDFGCHDQNGSTIVCTSGQNCINNGGFDNNFNFNLSNIWCNNCKARFNPNTYN